MWKNYLRVAFRNFARQRSQSIINVFGLAVGMTGCILIMTYVGYEFSFDGYHANADNIVRIVSRRVSMGRTNDVVAVPAPVGPTLVQDFPEVVGAVRFSPTVKRAFSHQDRKFFQDDVFYADRSVFDVFSFELVAGDPKTALELPFTMVVTESTARKYFGGEDPLGKTVNWDNRFDYRVTGVVKDPPPNSHFTFTVLASFSTFIEYDPRIGEWRGGTFPTYVLLQDNADPEEFAGKLESFDKEYLAPVFAGTGVELTTFLQPLRSIHLHSRLEGEVGANGDVRVVYAFLAIAFVILLVACINFMNLTTARAAGRAKEVGMRKILGAERRRLALQFLGESMLHALVALAVGVFAARVLLPYFSRLAGHPMSFANLSWPAAVGGLAGIALFVGLAAGSYPALFLSAFRPISILRGTLVQGARSSRFRSVLVVFQFAVTTVLIIGTAVIFSQFQYLQNKDLGFDKENLLVVAIQNDEVRIGLESFKAEVMRIPGIAGAGASSMVPGEMYLFNLPVYPEGMPEDQTVRMDSFLVDYGFLDTFGVEVVEGRGFSRNIPTDKTDAVMINETAARRLQWTEPLGKAIERRAAFSDEVSRKIVIGVFRDIHQRSLYAAVEPTFVEYIGTEGAIENRARRLAIRLETEDLAGTMAAVERTWQNMFPNHPYYSFFLDDFYDGQHRSEARLGGLFRAFSVVAVFIGCNGLFGLASYTAERRTKEIGIRKVLGSSAGGIVVLLGREFVILIALANAVAWPVALLAAREWLQNFPYAVRMEWGVFVVTAALTLVIASLSVGYQSVKAALANPAEALRYE